MKLKSDKDNFCKILRVEPTLYDFRAPPTYYVCKPREALRLLLAEAHKERKRELALFPHLAQYYEKHPVTEYWPYKDKLKKLRKSLAKCKYYRQRSGGGCEFSEEDSDACKSEDAIINARFNEVYEDL